MSLRIISIGTKAPSWTHDAVQIYQKRLPKDWAVNLTEVPAQKRLKNTNLNQAIEIESQKLWQHCHRPEQNIVIGLDRTGKQVSSKELAQHLGLWKNQGKMVHFIIGGPEGIAESTLSRCHQIWSFSDLTFPHPLVRVILLEQIYRSFCIVSQRTYHR